MLSLVVFFSVGALVAADPVNITAVAPIRFSRSVGLTLLNAEDTAAVLRTARPGIDYPIFEFAPKTSFNCKTAGIVVGLRYADAETGCQVFHICDEAGLDTTYLCPNKTIFNDQSQVCEWFHQVDCSLAYKPPQSVIILPVVATAVVTQPEVTAIVSPVVATAVVTQPEVTAVILPVVEVKPCTVTTCPPLIHVPVQPAEAPPKWENQAASNRPQRPLAPVVVVSSAPIRPSTDNTAPISLGTGILSNLKPQSGWGSSLQTPAPVAVASSGWGSASAIAVPQVTVAAPVAKGWGSQTQQLAAPVSTGSGWGSQRQMG